MDEIVRQSKVEFNIEESDEDEDNGESLWDGVSE